MNISKKTLRNNLHLLLLAAALAGTGVLVVACGGGGGGGGGGTGVGATRSLGEITKLGSIFVNGVEFHTTGTPVVMDGQTVADDHGLHVGMVVEVEGTINDDRVTGTATKVTFDDTLQGIAQTKDTAAGSITVMGKKVLVDDLTKIEDTAGAAKTLADVAASTTEVQVSGALDDNGNLHATNLQLKTEGVSEATGEISAVTGSGFTLAGIPVTSTGVTIKPAGATLADGKLVEVKGTFAAGAFTATSIEVKNVAENEGNFEFEGFVISGDSGSFVLQGSHLAQTMTVSTTSSTTFIGGNKTDLVAGTKVEVDGNLVNGALTATKVQFKENFRIEITAGAQLAGTPGIELRFLPGITVLTDANTRITGNLTNVIDNADLKIRGRLSGDGTKVIATRLDINNPRSSNIDRVVLRGPVKTIAADKTSFTVLGVTVPVTGVTFRPNDDSGNDSTQTVSSTDFFANLKEGTVVKIKGTLSATGFAATEIELED
jgi:hypothetical protein